MGSNGVSEDVREIGGELVSSLVASSASVQVEVLRRQSSRPIEWNFRQSRDALFWFRSGINRFTVSAADDAIATELSPRADLALIPADTDVHGEFDVGDYSDYVVVFLDRPTTTTNSFGLPRHPMIGFGHPEVRRSFARLATEAAQQDEFFDMLVEGWILQASAYLNRLSRPSAGTTSSFVGGLAPSSLRRVRHAIEDRLDEHISIAWLASISGLSSRHFLRAFRQSTGLTPQRYITEVRLRRAREMLASDTESITAIAFACGFTHSQHFTTWFKRETGLTPSHFRANIRL
ncbi:helix-turn-helix domain-containing protein [Rhodococcus wratislaviensis]|uniref:HTH araC/xylS-type domain-containing protein n=1 Tax=Rhodococcus wratislaviensis NBRC 100605 TaxID=1219028 RepID=X0Q9Q7_RHOWR|nr:AraC family transcriptional regulator [Rhodococcus wratislaviensis]GAF48327.1 hypothetical protein RW1_052_00340 [Rhodococcus wratislaviensis NBRC 100605]